MVTVHGFFSLIAPAVKQGFFTSPRCKIGGFFCRAGHARHLWLLWVAATKLSRVRYIAPFFFSDTEQ